MKQTAVEWLIEQWPILESQLPQQLIQQAKAMEKEQIIDIIKLVIEKEYHEQTWSKCGSISYVAEQYYKETFKSENVVMFMNTENSGIESIKLTDNPDCGIKGITFKSE